MTWKPFESKSLMDQRKSTKRDWPPKRKLPSYNETFAEMEQYHYDNYQPWGEHPIARKVRDNCRGRVLRPLSQVTWESGTGGIPKDGDVKEFQASVSGAIGEVTYSLDSRWREVNEEGDVATIDPGTGLISLPEGACQGAWPPWLIYFVCDDCGCSSGTIWLEDSSGDCLDCETCDCEDTEADCYDDCCGWTESGTEQATTQGDTKTFTCAGGGEWSLAGAGLNGSTILDGVLSVSGTACGTIEVINSICGSRFVAVTDSGKWVFDSDTDYGSSIIIAGGCTAISGGNCTVTTPVYQTKSWWTSRCACNGSTVELEGLPSCASSSISCTPTACGGGNDPCLRYDYITRQFINKWGCP